MGTLYRAFEDSLGNTAVDSPVAIYENGKIYSATPGFGGVTSKGTLIGEYENGFVYSVSSYSRAYCIGNYGGGKICRVSSGVGGGVVTAGTVATYGSGKIYRSNGAMQYSDVIGMYDGDADGAAAAAAIALLHLSSGVHATSVTSHIDYNSGTSSSDNGSGARLPGCSGFSFWWLLLIGVICVAVSDFWRNHPVISCVILSAALGAIFGFLIFRKSKSKVLIAVVAFVVSLVALFHLADMSNRYHYKSYLGSINGQLIILERGEEPTYRGVGVYKNWKGKMYCYPSTTEEFCAGVVATSASLVPEETDDALFFDMGNPIEKRFAVITLQNQATGQQKQFYGYIPDYSIDRPDLSMVPLEEVAEWLGYDVKLSLTKIDFVQIS
ncbi:MAG: hypothetical protein IJC88_03810 [Oscillospiraceae bacterium]|nr:hypothetical protein [Oscillospiraceae bacterium]